MTSPNISTPADIFAGDTLGAFCRHTHVTLPGAINGPLAGLAFGLKDIFDVAGHRTGFGSPDWLDTHDVALSTAPVATRLLAAGATLAGKTHTEEMAFSLTGENAHYGTPLNPAAPGRVPGGSSSGSAVAVAGGLVDFAIGSDTGGSVRGPASFCGVFGFRPTHGRISLTGACPLAPSFDTCGWFARDADLLARVGDVLLGPSAAAAPLLVPKRLLLAHDAFGLAFRHAAAALAPAVAALENAFGEAAPVTVAPEGLSAWFDVFRVLQYAEIWEAHGAWVTAVQPNFGAQIAARFAAVATTNPADVAVMRQRRGDIADRLDALLGDNAVLLLPSMPDIAPPCGALPEATVAFRERALAMLCIAGLGGLPQVSLPVAQVDGCPLGLSLIAARGNDALLLNTARQVVRLQGMPLFARPIAS